MKVGGFPVMSYQRVAHVQTKDISKVPKTYIDLKLSASVDYEWVSQVFSDKYRFHHIAIGSSREIAEQNLFDKYDQIIKDKITNENHIRCI